MIVFDGLRRAALASLLVIAGSAVAAAADHEVHMLNSGAKGPMVFEPDFIEAAPGDTITFVPTQPGHNVEGVKGMLPDGVQPFKSGFNERYVLTVTAEGVYGVKCTPHYGMGMVALIEVGEPKNLDAAIAVKHPGRAQAVFTELLAKIGTAN